MKEFFRIKNHQPFLKRTQIVAVCFVFLFFAVIFFVTPAIAHAGVVEWMMNGLARIIGVVVQLLGVMLVQIVNFLIWIASYNNIIYQPAVIKGWLVMRDVLNVGFIIFMMIIAFGTIFNLERYSYKSMLAKVLLAAILVNFSKTLVGLAIDMAHVFTMMFFNAYKSAAAGNITEALGLKEMIKFSDQSGSFGDASETLVAYLLAVVMLIIAIVTVLVYLLVFATRIIILWFLTITSPVFFVMRAVPFGEKYASQWMTEFGKYVPMGPILAFFLWLSFAIMGTSHSTFDTVLNNAGGENIVGTGGNEVSVGVSSVGQPANMWSFIISIGVLWMALKYAGQTSGIAGKFAGTMMGKLQSAGGKALKGTLKAPFKVAGGSLARAKWLKKGVDSVAGAQGRWGQLAKFTGVRALSEHTGLAMAKNRAGYKKKGKERADALKQAGMEKTMMRTATGKKITPMGRAKKEAVIGEVVHKMSDQDVKSWAKDASDKEALGNPTQLRAVANRLIEMWQKGDQGARESYDNLQKLAIAEGTNTAKYILNVDKDGNEVYERDDSGNGYKVDTNTQRYIRNQRVKEEDVRTVEETQIRFEGSKTYQEGKYKDQKGNEYDIPKGQFAYHRYEDDKYVRYRLDEDGKEKKEPVAESGGIGQLGNVTIAAQNVVLQDQGKQRLEIGAQEFVQLMQEKDNIESQINSAQQEATSASKALNAARVDPTQVDQATAPMEELRKAQEKVQQLEDRKKNIEPALRVDKQRWGIPKNQDSLSKDEIAKFLPDLVKQAQSQGMVGPQLQEFENYLKTAQNVPIEDTRKAQDKVGGVDAVINQQKMGLAANNPKLYLDNEVLHAAGMKGVAGAMLHVQGANSQDQQRLEKFLNALDQKMARQGYSEAERAMAQEGLQKSDTIRVVNTDAKLHQGERGEQEQYLSGLEEKMHNFVGQLPKEVLMQFWNALGGQKAVVQQKITEEYKGTYGAEPPEEMIADEFLSKSLVNATRYGKKDDTTYQLNDAMKTMIEQSQDFSMQFMKSALKSGTLPPPAPAKQQSAFRYNVDSEQMDQEVSEGVQEQSAQEQPQRVQDSTEVIDALREVGEQVQGGAQQVSATVLQTSAKAMKQQKKEGQETRKQAGDIAKQQAWVQKNTARRMQTAMNKNQEQILQQGVQTGEQVQNVGEQVGTVADNQTTESTQPVSLDREASNTQETTSPVTEESAPQSHDTVSPS